jgi:hypothetical protein
MAATLLSGYNPKAVGNAANYQISCGDLGEPVKQLKRESGEEVLAVSAGQHPHCSAEGCVRPFAIARARRLSNCSCHSARQDGKSR